MRSSSIFKNIEVVFHISSSWVKIRLHTENQLPGLPGSALKVSVVGLGVVGSTELCFTGAFGFLIILIIIQGSLVRHNGTYGSRSIWLDVLGCEQLDLFDYLILVSVFRYLGNLIILILVCSHFGNSFLLGSNRLEHLALVSDYRQLGDTILLTPLNSACNAQGQRRHFARTNFEVFTDLLLWGQQQEILCYPQEVK